jgi:hypothetical protein
MYIQYHSWHAESYLEGHGLWARGHGRGQTNRQHSNERSFLCCCASLSSQCSLAPLSLSSFFRCHFLRRCAAALLWTYAEWIFCDLVSTLSVVFSFFSVWKISPDIYGFSFFFCVLCLSVSSALSSMSVFLSSFALGSDSCLAVLSIYLRAPSLFILVACFVLLLVISVVCAVIVVVAAVVV